MRVEHLSWTISINNPESPEVTKTTRVKPTQTIRVQFKYISGLEYIHLYIAWKVLLGYIFIKFIISVKQVGHKKAYNRSFGIPIILLCKFFVDFYSNVHLFTCTCIQKKPAVFAKELVM